MKYITMNGFQSRQLRVVYNNKFIGLKEMKVSICMGFYWLAHHNIIPFNVKVVFVEGYLVIRAQKDPIPGFVIN